MKIKPKLIPQAPKLEDQPKPKKNVMKRTNIYVPPELLEQVAALEKRVAGLGIDEPISLSFLVREGAAIAIERWNAKLDKAANGSFHAKKRK